MSYYNPSTTLNGNDNNSSNNSNNTGTYAINNTRLQQQNSTGQQQQQPQQQMPPPHLPSPQVQTLQQQQQQHQQSRSTPTVQLPPPPHPRPPPPLPLQPSRIMNPIQQQQMQMPMPQQQQQQPVPIPTPGISVPVQQSYNPIQGSNTIRTRSLVPPPPRPIPPPAVQPAHSLVQSYRPLSFPPPPPPNLLAQQQQQQQQQQTYQGQFPVQKLQAQSQPSPPQQHRLAPPPPPLREGQGSGPGQYHGSNSTTYPPPSLQSMNIYDQQKQQKQQQTHQYRKPYPVPPTPTLPPPPQQQPYQQQQPQQQYQQQQQQQRPSKIDPSQIPRPTLFTFPQQQLSNIDNEGNSGILSPAPAQQQQQQQQQLESRPLPVYYTKSSSLLNDNNNNNNNSMNPILQQAAVPPQGNTRYAIVDDGYASPNLIRSTVYSIPLDRSCHTKTGNIPLGLMCTPMAVHNTIFVPSPRSMFQKTNSNNSNDNDNDTTQQQQQQWYDNEAIPVIKINDDSNNNTNTNTNNNKRNYKDPLRCLFCGTYVNPGFTQQGSCNMCGTKNRNIGTSIQSLILNNSPIVQVGTVEYEVSGSYITRTTPIQQIYIYSIDLSCPNHHFIEYISIIRTVATQIYDHYQRQISTTTMTGDNRHYDYQQQEKQKQQIPIIGICWFSANGIILPNLKVQQEQQQQQKQDNGVVVGIVQNNFVIVSDVSEGPFNPIPLNDWTFDISTDSGLHTFLHFLDTTMLSSNDDNDNVSTFLKNEVKRRSYTGKDGYELSCAGAVMAFISDALQYTGGRGTIITWRLPNFGIGTITYKEEQNNLKNGIEDCTITVPLQYQTEFKNPIDADASKFYKKLQKQCQQRKVVLDIVLHTSQLSLSGNHYYDIATIGNVCQNTSGRLIWIQSDITKKNDIDKRLWKQSLQNELLKQVLSFNGWDVVFKVRCSDGIRVKSFLGHDKNIVLSDAVDDIDFDDDNNNNNKNNNTNSNNNNTADDEIEMNCITPTTCIVVELEHRIGGISKDRPYIFIQTALLYTDIMSGIRRVRVSTLALKTTSIVNDIYKSIDFSAFSVYIIRSTIHNFLSTNKQQSNNKNDSRKNAREYIFQLCVNILSNYKINLSSSTSGNHHHQQQQQQQLLLPEKMHLLPLFIMGLLKSCMLRKSITKYDPNNTKRTIAFPLPDERSYQQYYCNTHITSVTAMLCIHPNVFALPTTIGSSMESIGCTSGSVGQWVNTDYDLNALGYYHMPPNLPPSIEIIQDNLAYIIDDGLRLFLYIGKDVPSDTVEMLHQSMLLSYSTDEDDNNNNDESTSHRKNTSMLVQQQSDTQLSYNNNIIQSILWQIRTLSSIKDCNGTSIRPTWPMIEIITGTQQHNNNNNISSYITDRVRSISMVLDATITGDKDYVDFLCTVHQNVRTNTKT